MNVLRSRSKLCALLRKGYCACAKRRLKPSPLIGRPKNGAKGRPIGGQRPKGAQSQGSAHKAPKGRPIGGQRSGAKWAEPNLTTPRIRTGFGMTHTEHKGQNRFDEEEVNVLIQSWYQHIFQPVLFYQVIKGRISLIMKKV